MLPEMVMAKVESATQASLLSGLAGKSYTVAQVTSTGNGLGTFLFLTPNGSAAAAAQGAVALKLEGTRQMAQMSGLVGKSVIVGKTPLVVGGLGKWVTFYPTSAALAAKGLAGTGAAAGAAALAAKGVMGSDLIMLKLEGAKFAAQTPYLTGKTFTVLKTTAVAGEPNKWLFLQPVGKTAAAAKEIVVLKVQNAGTQLSWLVGKTYTVGQAPIMAGGNAAKCLVLKPVASMGAATVAGGAGAAKALTVAGGANAGTVKIATIAVQKAAVATGAATAVSAGSAAAGTIWTGSGMSLGLGLGLGAWGPALLVGLVGAGAAYGYLHLRKNRDVEADEDIELREAMAS